MAHVPNETYSQISVKHNQTIVVTELPWSFRNALLAFDQDLAQAEQKAQFERTALKYFKEYLVLRNRNEPLELISLTEITHGGHSHQVTFQLVFDGNQLSSVENRLLFNVYDQAINYHTMEVDWELISFQSSLEAPTFLIPPGI